MIHSRHNNPPCMLGKSRHISAWKKMVGAGDTDQEVKTWGTRENLALIESS